MKEFQKLLESELLDADTKKDLQESIESFKATVIAEATKNLEVTYAEKVVADKKELAENVYKMIQESVDQEVAELKEDIQHYKDIEPTYAAKLAEFKTEYSKKLSESFEGLVQESTKAEIAELKEDLLEAKKDNFGMEIFESVKATFEKLGVSDDMQKIKDDLAATQAELKESKEIVAKAERSEVMEGLLSNLKGGKREVMQTILENVSTDKLEVRYNETVEKVINESTEIKKPVVKEVVVESDNKDAAMIEYRNLLT